MVQSKQRVTTTSSIDGWTIESYLGVVASHVVAGTGFGSDILAGFSDFFGGRSGAYQNQLNSLYNEAIGQLHRKGEQLGGNWIVGLKVDIDEVSGKGMQMFMVTAMGTAVRAAHHAQLQEPGSNGSGLAISAADVRKMERKLMIVESAMAKKLVFDEPTWEFIVEQGLEEVASSVLEWTVKVQGDGSWEEMDQATKQRALLFFRNLPVDRASDILYAALGADTQTARVAVSLLEALSLVSFRRSLDGLRADNVAVRHWVVQTLTGHQQAYDTSDAAVIDAIITELATAFADVTHVVQAKGLLRGTRQRWICACGERNAVEEARCGKCSRDVQGFLHYEVTPAKALEALRERRAALAALMPS